MKIMSDDNFEELRRLYEALSDFYFEIPESETTQDDRDSLLKACNNIEEVLFAHETETRNFQ